MHYHCFWEWCFNYKIKYHKHFGHASNLKVYSRQWEFWSCILFVFVQLTTARYTIPVDATRMTMLMCCQSSRRYSSVVRVFQSRWVFLQAFYDFRCSPIIFELQWNHNVRKKFTMPVYKFWGVHSPMTNMLSAEIVYFSFFAYYR